MRPVLFSVLGVDVQTYGVSKVIAAVVAAALLARVFSARGLGRQLAYDLVFWGTVWGFVGAKAYYLAEQLPDVTMHDLGGMGFTWYGGLVGGLVAVVVIARRRGLRVPQVADDMAVPLSVAYGIGRLGCLASGDGTYGRPTSLPWGMSFPDGVVASDVPVHPTPVYEALGAFLLALVLWRLRGRYSTGGLFGVYLIGSGAARFLVEFLRTNEPVVLGLSQPQLWAAAGMVVGAVVVARAGRRGRAEVTAAPVAPDAVPVGG